MQKISAGKFHNSSSEMKWRGTVIREQSLFSQSRLKISGIRPLWVLPPPTSGWTSALSSGCSQKQVTLVLVHLEETATSVISPTRPTCAAHKVVGYLRYCGPIRRATGT